MELQAIQVNGTPVTATDAEVTAAEEQLWLTFPQGYREYVTTLGEGVLGGSWVRIYPPWRVSRELAVWRERVGKHWFWDHGKATLPQERGVECVLLGDTTEGDELVFHPGRPDRLLVLPHSSGEVFEVGAALLIAVEWMCSSGKLTKPFSERSFEPFDSRKEKRTPPKATAPAETLDETVAALQKWADGRKLAKIAQKHLADWLAKREEPFYGVGRKEAQKDKIKVVLKNQSLTFRPEKYWDPQVVTTFTLIDTETGCHLGEYLSFAELNGDVKGSGDALMYPQAVALAENWLGLTLD